MARWDLIFRVFVSSTFKDLVQERNALQEKTFLWLRKYCEQRGAWFQAIDLRWGVNQEAALDQQTMSICLQELARCQEISPILNFIILLGERYGSRLLPSRIPANEFEKILACMGDFQRKSMLVTDKPVSAWRDGKGVNRIGWYRKDMNAVPAEYVLQARTIDFPPHIADDDKRRICEEEEKDWDECQTVIRSLLASAISQLGWKKDDPRRQRYERSATHQEIDHGLLHPDLDAQNHVFAYFRRIVNPPADGSAADFVDSGHDKDDLEVLKLEIGGNPEHGIQGRLPNSHVYRYDAAWHDNRPEPDFNALCERVFQDLKGVIDAELKDFQRRPELEHEKEAHREFAQERCRHFIGRQDVLKRIKDYLADPQDNRPLVIHGVSGCGKTALMAQAWLTITDPEYAVARFVGGTPGSADLRTLLRSLCRQLGIESPPTDMNELVKTFRDRLAGPDKGDARTTQPNGATVFLDALDQLNPTDNSRGLHWLPRKLAPGVKLVLSVLQIDRPAEQAKPTIRDDCYDIAKRIWPDHLAEISVLSHDDGETLLSTWLDGVGRTLQEDQHQEVLDKFDRNGRPLYLKAAFEEAKNWRSWEGLPCKAVAGPGLSDTVEGVLASMLHRLEEPRYHGQLFVERTLGSIAASKNGLTEDELLDVLSSDKAVMKDYFDRNPKSPKIDHLPFVIWSRLLADLGWHIAERRADGTVVMNFYHVQVSEVVKARYFTEMNTLLNVHIRLGDYFHRLDYWIETLDEQRARAKRLPPTPRPANVRKVVELPYHRLEAAKLGGKEDPKHWDAVADLLTDWQFLEAKAEADPNFQEQGSTDSSSALGEAKP
jgi:hypothetical protein